MPASPGSTLEDRAPGGRTPAEQTLQMREEHLRLALSAGAMATWEWHVPTGRVTWNDEHFRMLGYAPGEVEPTFAAWAARVHPEDLAATQALLQASMAQGSEYRAEFRAVRPDGSVRWMEARGRTSLDAAGQPLRQLGVMLDITERKNAAQALRTSEATLRAVLDATKESVWLFDADGIIRLGNRTALERLHKPAAEVLGRPFRELVPAAVADARNSQLQQVVASGQPAEFEDERAGIQFQHNFYPVFDGAGHVTHVAAYSRDVTGKKRTEQALRQSEERLLRACRAGRVGLYEWNSTTGTGYWSPETYALLGLDPHTLASMEQWMTCVHPDDREHHTRVLAALMEEGAARPNGTSLQDRFRVRHPDGTVLSLEAVTTLERDGTDLILRGAVRDISEHQQAQDALAAANAQLVLEAHRKNEFLGVLSHELRNPLAPIRNGVYLLQRLAPSAEQARQVLQVMDRQVTHLTRLVEDLLDVTRITRGKVRLQRQSLDLAAVLRRTVEDHGSVLGTRTVDLQVPAVPVWVDGDPTRLVQVIGNLLTNAAKFGGQDAQVTVSLSRTPEHAVLEVADTGMGIDAETLPRLFEPFAQADRSLDRSLGGLGLGLALVKGMVELHGGQVSAHSKGPGHGARFTVRLPLDPKAPPARPAVKVLVLEDNRDTADSLAQVLGILGHPAAVAYSGEAGVQKAREFGPDVVLCDLGLPGDLDGYGVGRALRRDPGTAAAFLVALSGCAQAEDPQRALAAGFDVQLSKPLDLDALQRLLAQQRAAPR